MDPPPACGEEDRHRERTVPQVPRSTRPRGARPEKLGPVVPDRRFNPRARVGRDSNRLRRVAGRLMFQSTRLRGARRARVSVDALYPEVSIHAPAWGATAQSSQARESRSSFNPRARVGRDEQSSPRSAGTYLFQSTRPRGARPGSR
ncbi:hypothetical protein Plut_1304 [Pelodictyon luteolum DSM 273]|nr:hypothetical protein Plut_1304 [Pelodictyon luteolum DSM 273]